MTLTIQSKCCNGKRAKGEYLVFCGGLSLSIPVQWYSGPIEFLGPDTPSHEDPIGAFSYISAGGTVGGMAYYPASWIGTGKLGSWTTQSFDAVGFIDLGIDAFFGFTNKLTGNTECCNN